MGDDIARRGRSRPVPDRRRVRPGGLIWFHPALGVTYRRPEGLRALASQYWHYGRWRRVVAREHAGTVNARYLAPPAAALAFTAGTLAGLVGVITGSPVLLAAGFAVPALYIAGILAVTATAARALPRRALAWLPAALITMHLLGNRVPGQPARPR